MQGQVATERGPVDFERVFREYGPFVWRTLRRMGLSEADADDATQEVFIVVHGKLDTFEGRSSLRTWIYGICLRTASNVRRRARPAPLPAAEPGVGPDLDDGVALRQARQLLDRALDELDEDKRAVFVLYEIEQLSMAEVVEAVGCPLQTGYSRLHAARERVTAALARLRAERSRP